MSIDKIQKEIIEEFKMIGPDLESRLEYLIAHGEDLSYFDDKYKLDKNKIEGCLSSIWMICRKENETLYYEGDSNTKITKGLLSLLLRIFSNQLAEDIVNSKLYFVDVVGIGQMIGTQRINGYNNIYEKILLEAKKTL